jgi:hypothetical protein
MLCSLTPTPFVPKLRAHVCEREETAHAPGLRAHPEGIRMVSFEQPTLELDRKAELSRWRNPCLRRVQHGPEQYNSARTQEQCFLASAAISGVTQPSKR